MSTEDLFERDRERDAQFRDGASLVEAEAPATEPSEPGLSEPGAPAWNKLRVLSDHELDGQLARLIKKKHLLDAEVLLCLSEVDRRRLYRDHACPSLFGFCVTRLGFSEDVAWKRVGAARMLRQFPFAYVLLAEGRLHLTGFMLVGPHLTENNHREWLLAAAGKSKREIEKLVATRCPKPDVPSRVRKLPERRSPGDMTPCGAAADTSGVTCGAVADAAVAVDVAVADAAVAVDVAVVDARGVMDGVVDVAGTPAPALPAPVPLAPPLTTSLVSTSARLAARPLSSRSTVAPLSENTYRVVFTARESLKQKLDRARELASHVVYPGDLPGLIERALELLIASEERRRCGKLARVRESFGTGKGDGASAETGVADAPQDPDPARSVETEVASEREPSCVPEREPRCTDVAEPHAGALPAACSPDGIEPRARALPAALPSLEEFTHFARHVPASTRREIWKRACGQCTYVDAEGNRCPCRHFLQIDHAVPYALGGPPTVGNCRLVCAAHNRHWAEQVFGRGKIDRDIERKRRGGATDGSPTSGSAREP
jgi:hypothetical protein